MLKNISKLAVGFFICTLVLAVYVQDEQFKHWQVQTHFYPIAQEQDELIATINGQQTLVEPLVPFAQSQLSESSPKDFAYFTPQWVKMPDEKIAYVTASYHFGIWSLLPAIATIAICLITRSPLPALLAGIAVGTVMLSQNGLTGGVLIPALAQEGAVFLLILYLWLLGGLLGMWSKTGAAKAFADYMTKTFVKGPRSAKLVAWTLGIIFFQGGSMSTVLVGTTVRPLADKAKVSHEEMSYIVDSTASPIAALIAFNAWPAYIQALIFIPGVTFLATEADRISFFFSSIPFSFYAILAVVGTLLLSLNVTMFAGKRIRMAQQRALTTGELDAPGAKPLSTKSLQTVEIPAHYKAHHLEFVLPLIALVLTAVATFVLIGTPEVTWAFSAALLVSVVIALSKGMSFVEVFQGIGAGLKGVIIASVILILAVVIGGLSQQVGGGLYLISLLGESLPYWLLPVTLQLLTMAIAFSTGTSWGTYAIAFPLAMPLAWAIAQSQGVTNPEVFMMICFATVLNGSVYGDQCSPISDTTILSSMTTGCDLMDHVKSQIFPASFAAILAGALWTLCALWLA